MRRRYPTDSEEHNHGGELHGRYKREHNEEHIRKQSRYDGSRRTSARSDWDDGRWEWEDTPHWDNHPNTSRHHQPSPSPLLFGAPPDAQSVSPWTCCFSLEYCITFSSSNTGIWIFLFSIWWKVPATYFLCQKFTSEDGEADKSYFSKDNNAEISESMHLEMEYNSDRAWYDREEGNTMFDVDSSSFFLVRRDAREMMFDHCKKLPQLTADNAQWEDGQLLRSGVVRITEVQTEFDDEEEQKVILLVHDAKPPFLDGRVVFMKQAEPIMPLRDPTSDMAMICQKGSSLVWEIHEKQSTNKSCQHFWELAGSKLGDILGVEKKEEQVDADTAVVGEQGEVDFMEDAKYA